MKGSRDGAAPRFVRAKRVLRRLARRTRGHFLAPRVRCRFTRMTSQRVAQLWTDIDRPTAERADQRDMSINWIASAAPEEIEDLLAGLAVRGRAAVAIESVVAFDAVL